jgi:hypothetical protein
MKKSKVTNGTEKGTKIERENCMEEEEIALNIRIQGYRMYLA